MDDFHFLSVLVGKCFSVCIKSKLTALVKILLYLEYNRDSFLYRTLLPLLFRKIAVFPFESRWSVCMREI